jgi:CRP-like cAMP-binding protein
MASVEFLHKVPIFATLKREQLQPLTDKLRRRHYQRGEVIFHQDDPGDRLHLIVAGLVKISITSEDGREQDIALLHPGECFGEMSLLDGSNRSATTTAVEATDTLVLLREDFLSFFREHPEVAMEITSLLARRLRNMNQMLGDMVFLDVPTRVAKQLLELAGTYTRDSEVGGPIVVPLGQDELARLVGASRETVSRALNSYRRQGILVTSHRRITITNLRALERMAS